MQETTNRCCTLPTFLLRVICGTLLPARTSWGEMSSKGLEALSLSQHSESRFGRQWISNAVKAVLHWIQSSSSTCINIPLIFLSPLFLPFIGASNYLHLLVIFLPAKYQTFLQCPSTFCVKFQDIWCLIFVFKLEDFSLVLTQFCRILHSTRANSCFLIRRASERNLDLHIDISK